MNVISLTSSLRWLYSERFPRVAVVDALQYPDAFAAFSRTSLSAFSVSSFSTIATSASTKFSNDRANCFAWSRDETLSFVISGRHLYEVTQRSSLSEIRVEFVLDC